MKPVEDRIVAAHPDSHVRVTRFIFQRLHAKMK
jgi:hypothetical protein